MDEPIQIARHFYTAKERPQPILLHDLRRAKFILLSAIDADLTDCQEAALLSLIADLVSGLAHGSQKFNRSKLAEALNANLYQIAASEFFDFCYVDGRVNKRQWDKRNCEQILFRRGYIEFPPESDY